MNSTTNATNPIDRLGGTTAVAKIVGCRAASVHEWRHRGVPIERCPVIEWASQGKVTCEELRADVPWLRVADACWPMHPWGRPVHDVARHVLLAKCDSLGAAEATALAANVVAAPLTQEQRLRVEAGRMRLRQTA